MEVILPADTCLFWQCGKPLRDEAGCKKGARGMCWEHLKQMQRFEELQPCLPQAYNCIDCGRPWRVLRLGQWDGRCTSCYDKRWRRMNENYRTTERARKRRRAWKAVAVWPR